MKEVLNPGGVGPGKHRDTWKIRRYLDRRGMNQNSVATLAGVAPSNVSRTIKGVGNNRKVLKALLRIGISPDVLSLPEEMKEAV